MLIIIDIELQEIPRSSVTIYRHWVTRYSKEFC